MSDPQCCHQAATAPACPEKVTSLIAIRHLGLMDGEHIAVLPAWQTTAESLALINAELLEARYD